MEEKYESSGVHVKTLKLDQVYVWYIASTLFMQRQKKNVTVDIYLIGPLLCLFLQQYC